MKLLKKLYNIHAPSNAEDAMVEFLTSYLKRKKVKATVDEFKNVYVVKGESDTYPCVVAHTDEVHTVRPEGFKLVNDDYLIMAVNMKKGGTAGIGADDKNGIWVALKLLDCEDIPAIKLVFFASEEIGCVGSNNADLSFFDDCRFVLQCDRKGGNDFIDNAGGIPLCTSEFKEALQVTDFGYKPTFGSLTDVRTLKSRGLKVCCANISCGYYNPHTASEYTVFPELEHTLEFVKNAVVTVTEVYSHEYVKPEPARYSYKTNTWSTPISTTASKPSKESTAEVLDTWAASVLADVREDTPQGILDKYKDSLIPAVIRNGAEMKSIRKLLNKLLVSVTERCTSMYSSKLAAENSEESHILSEQDMKDVSRMVDNMLKEYPVKEFEKYKLITAEDVEDLAYCVSIVEDEIFDWQSGVTRRAAFYNDTPWRGYYDY